MRLSSLLTCLTAVLCMAFATRAHAELQRYEFDPAHTRVMFTVDHLGYSHMPGFFHTVTGDYSFDEENPTASTIDVTIDTKTVDMFHDVLNDKLRGDEFFKTDTYPTITFISTAVTTTGSNTGTVTGDLKLLGVTKPVTLDVTFNKGAINKYSGKYQTGFSATGVVKRSEFGMDYSLPGVGDDVMLNIQVEGVVAETTAETDTR